MKNCVVAETIEEFTEFLEKVINNSDFKLSEVKLSEQEQWQVQDGALSHSSGGFFHVNGLINSESEEELLMLYQPQSALTGLALCRKDQKVYVLLQARIEPGNSGIGQYGPTIQSTPANYLRLHGGKQTPCLDLFSTYSSRSRPIAVSMQLDIGKKYFQKSKSHTYVEVPELIPADDAMIWVPLNVIAQSLDRDNFLNADLRSLLSVMDWDSYQGNSSGCGVLSDSAAFKTALLEGSRCGAGIWSLTGVDQLTNWKLQDDGIIDVGETGVSVSFYHTSCKSREVKAWTQPLMKCSHSGIVQLLMRKKEDDFEFLVSLKHEPGISGGLTVLPSQVIYPGDRIECADYSCDGTVLSEFIQSDEGGRFYKHESVYKLILLAGDIEVNDTQYWISTSMLKQLLKSSNLMSFQLRCIASAILDILNPLTCRSRLIGEQFISETIS